MKRMKSGSDDVPVEAQRFQREMTVEFLTRLFNTILKSERRPEE